MTVFVNDTFTGGGDVAWTSHVGETGATWTMSTVYGTGVAADMRVTGGTLRRANYSTGEVWAYPNGTISGAAVKISVRIKFSVDADNHFFGIADSDIAWGPEPGNNNDFAYIYQDSVYIDGTYAAFDFTDNVEHLVEFELSATSRIVKVDSVELINISSYAIGYPYAFGMYHNNDLGSRIVVSELTVESLTPPGPPPPPPDFWTGFVGTHEVP